MVEKGKEKVTWMKLTTEPLDSEKNFNKVKKALCSLPQIRDQTFDEKNNTVTIKVVCCSPEKIMDKLCSKGRKAIKLIQTIDPPTQTQAVKPKEAEKDVKPPQKPKPAQAPAAQATPATQAPTPAAQVSQAAAGPSYQPVTMVGHPMHVPNGYTWNPNGYYERPVWDSYGGVPQPSFLGPRTNDYFSEEAENSCSLM